MGRRNTLFKFGGAITQLRTIARIFHVLWPGWIYPQRIRIPRIFHCQVWLPGGWKNVRPIRKQYPPKNIAWYGTMPSLLVLHWTENWQNKTYFFIFLCTASLWHRPKKCNCEWQLGRLIGSCWIEESPGNTQDSHPGLRAVPWDLRRSPG